MPLQMDSDWKKKPLILEPSDSSNISYLSLCSSDAQASSAFESTRSLAIAQQRGYTFLEMLVVIVLIGIFAAIAVPSVTAVDNEKLALAGSNIADAVRFSREESRRTNIVHGVAVDMANNRLRVFRLDETPNPNLKIFDVYQPISKQLYTVQLDAPPYSSVEISAVGGQMVGTCDDTGNIAFDPSGVVRCVQPLATRIADANIELTLSSLTLDIGIDSYTGRVSIQ